MDPVTMAIGSAIISGVGTMVGAAGEAGAMRAQADMEEKKAAVEAQWAEKKALQARTKAQAEAYDERRKGLLAKGKLTTLAGASGAGTDDRTIMDLWKGIDTEAHINEGRARAAGDQEAQGIKYQADLNSWTARSNAQIKRKAAKTTLIAGFLNSAGRMTSSMAGRYPSGGSGGGSSMATGFG